MKINQATRGHQTGAATLAVTVVILLIASLMVFFATRVGIMDQRMAGNEARYKEAFATAEAGLDLAIQRFINRFQTGLWTNIIANSTVASGTETDGTAAESGEPSFGVTVTNTGASLGGLAVYEFASAGVSADGTGRATVRRQATMKKILGGSAPDVPVIVAGSVGTGGNFNIVANPNGGGTGVPISIWTGKSNADVSFPSGQSSATCHMEYFDLTAANPQCSVPSGTNGELISQRDSTLPTVSSYDPIYPDILPNDPNFPDDLFQYLFGVSRVDWATVKSMAATYNHVVSDCSSLDETSGQVFRLWWVDGDCDMASNQVIGSHDDPVILVIDDHRLQMNGGGGVIYGVAYIFNNPDDPYGNVSECNKDPKNPLPPCVDFNGSSVIYGSLISEVGGQAMKGSYSIVYDAQLLNNLTLDNDSANFSIAYIPGSWRDF